MAKAPLDEPKSPPSNLTGLAESESDINCSRQAASVLAQQLGETLTTNQGLRISDDQNSLRAGSRGPKLLENHILRERIMHLYHQGIPNRVGSPNSCGVTIG